MSEAIESIETKQQDSLDGLKDHVIYNSTKF